MPRGVLCARIGSYAESLELREVPAIESLPPHTLKLRVACAGLAFPDLLQVEGKYQMKLEAPYIPGAEVAGKVVAIGPGADQGSTWQVGDRVAGWSAQLEGRQRGGLAEEALIYAGNCLRLPEGVSFETGVALLRNYYVVNHALSTVAKLQQGETLMVLGAAGACGLCAIDLGKALGARVVACASTEEKLQVCRGAGADVVVDYDAGGSEGFLAALRQAEVYRKVDVIFDPVGGRYAETAFRALAALGRFVVFGFAAGGTDPKSAFPNLPLNLLLMRGQQVLGSVAYGELLGRGERLPSSVVLPKNPLSELLDWAKAGRLKPFVSKTYSLENFAQAFHDLANRRAIGKVIVLVSPLGGASRAKL